MFLNESNMQAAIDYLLRNWDKWDGEHLVHEYRTRKGREETLAQIKKFKTISDTQAEKLYRVVYARFTPAARERLANSLRSKKRSKSQTDLKVKVETRNALRKAKILFLKKNPDSEKEPTHDAVIMDALKTTYGKDIK